MHRVCDNVVMTFRVFVGNAGLGIHVKSPSSFSIRRGRPDPDRAAATLLPIPYILVRRPSGLAIDINVSNIFLLSSQRALETKANR